MNDNEATHFLQELLEIDGPQEPATIDYLTADDIEDLIDRDQTGQMADIVRDYLTKRDADPDFPRIIAVTSEEEAQRIIEAVRKGLADR